MTEMELRPLLANLKSNLPNIDFAYRGSGCEARAHEISRYLETRGAFAAKIFIQGPGLNKRAWDFHVAVALREVDVDGRMSWVVVDPSFFDHPVDVRTWIDKVTMGESRSTKITLASRFTYRLPSINGGKFNDAWDMAEVTKACESNRWNSLFIQSANKTVGDRLTRVMMGKESLWGDSEKPRHCDETISSARIQVPSGDPEQISISK